MATREEKLAAIDWSKICPGLKLAISALEAIAPTTPTPFDDFGLMGLKIVYSRRCGGPSMKTELEDWAERDAIHLAEAVAEAFEDRAAE